MTRHNPCTFKATIPIYVTFCISHIKPQCTKWNLSNYRIWKWPTFLRAGIMEWHFALSSIITTQRHLNTTNWIQKTENTTLIWLSNPQSKYTYLESIFLSCHSVMKSYFWTEILNLPLCDCIEKFWWKDSNAFFKNFAVLHWKATMRKTWLYLCQIVYDRYYSYIQRF